VDTMYRSLPPSVENPCFVTISDDQKVHFEAIFERKAERAYNGVDPSFYKAIPGVKRTDRFLFLARFSTIKGADLAIKACLEAGVGLDLVGDTQITHEPAYLQHCLSLASQQSPDWKKSEKQIVVHGGCSRGETVHWYSRAHCMLHPNERFREPFGLAPVEAMLCGLPVIAWDRGAMRETIAHGGSGLLVKDYPSLVNAIKSPWIEDITSEDRGGCREWAMKFSTENMVRRVSELCYQAIQEPW
jgi:glycosyltransferase involved in cell wall biosynthesis